MKLFFLFRLERREGKFTDTIKVYHHTRVWKTLRFCGIQFFFPSTTIPFPIFQVKICEFARTQHTFVA